MLFGLAQEGVAPKAFAKLSKRAVPAKGLTFSCICLLGGVVMLYVNPSDWRVHDDYNRFRDSVYVRLDNYPLLVPVYRKQRPHLHEKSITRCRSAS